MRIRREYIVLTNIVLMAALLAACIVYLHHFTEYVQFGLQLLTLTGLFAWVAFITNLLTEETKKHAQSSFEREILARPLTMALQLLGVLLFMLLYPAWHGTLVLDGRSSDATRLVVARAEHTGQEVELLLPERAVAKMPLPTSWFGQASYAVKVSGLPKTKLTIHWFERHTLTVPGDLWQQRLFLVRPAAVSAGVLLSGRYALTIASNGTTSIIEGYRGGPVWIGAASDVRVPEEVVARWRLELLSEGQPEVLSAVWDAPHAVSIEGFDEGVEVEVLLKNELGHVVARGVRSGARFGGLEEVVLRMTDED